LREERKEERQDMDLRARGSEFQMVGAANEKDRRPDSVFIPKGMLSSFLKAERSVRQGV